MTEQITRTIPGRVWGAITDKKVIPFTDEEAIFGLLEHGKPIVGYSVDASSAGSPGDCDFCRIEGGNSSTVFADVRTKHGPWAYVCQAHAETEGFGIGTGYGQLLV